MNFIITTTGNIEGGNILQYIDFISTNIVIGTNLFSDFAASFKDFFGGRSNSYKRKLDIIYNEARNELQKKAILLGANCIIGFRIDFDEISGKDKSMFMVAASGTACLARFNDNQDVHALKDCKVSQASLSVKIQERKIIQYIKAGKQLESEWTDILIETHPTEVILPLIQLYEEYCNDKNFEEEKNRYRENLIILS